MSTSYLLYRASPNAGTPDQWEGDLFERLGDVEELKHSIESLFSGCPWTLESDSWVSAGRTTPWLSLRLSPEDPNAVWYLSAMDAADDQLQVLSRELKLVVFNSEACELVSF